MKKTIHLSTHYPASCKITVEGRDTILVGDPNSFVSICADKNYIWPTPMDRPTVPNMGKGAYKVTTNNSIMFLKPITTKQLFLTCLPSDVMLELVDSYPDEWWIHDDFYNSNGVALQPKMHNCTIKVMPAPTAPLKNIDI